MKAISAISAIAAVLLLTSCSGMGMSGRSDTGSMGRSSYEATDFSRGFNPNNPYHGG